MSKEAVPEWIDPRPRFPLSGCVVMVKRANGKEERMVCDDTWDGRRWRPFPRGYPDSIADSEIVGWRHLSTTE